MSSRNIADKAAAPLSVQHLVAATCVHPPINSALRRSSLAQQAVG
ncbi:Uncharacterised protein [Vibrio cholerae]|nr:Uncharacterised protein [Vibrio cholerae]